MVLLIEARHWCSALPWWGETVEKTHQRVKASRCELQGVLWCSATSIWGSLTVRAQQHVKQDIRLKVEQWIVYKGFLYGLFSLFFLFNFFFSTVRLQRAFLQMWWKLVLCFFFVATQLCMETKIMCSEHVLQNAMQQRQITPEYGRSLDGFLWWSTDKENYTLWSVHKMHPLGKCFLGILAHGFPCLNLDLHVSQFTWHKEMWNLHNIQERQDTPERHTMGSQMIMVTPVGFNHFVSYFLVNWSYDFRNRCHIQSPHLER